MAQEDIFMLMEQVMKEHGRMINKMEQVMKYGLMELVIKDHMF